MDSRSKHRSFSTRGSDHRAKTTLETAGPDAVQHPTPVDVAVPRENFVCLRAAQEEDHIPGVHLDVLQVARLEQRPEVAAQVQLVLIVEPAEGLLRACGGAPQHAISAAEHGPCLSEIPCMLCHHGMTV